MNRQGIEDIYNLRIHAENQQGEAGEESEGISWLTSVNVRSATHATGGDWPSESQRPREGETHCRLAVSLDT